MSRSTVRCSEAHTPQSPNKNRVRRDWLKPLKGKGDIITISHGLLESAMMVGHSGRIHVCDIDPGVIESTKYMRQSEYTDLCIPSVQLSSIEEKVKTYCEIWGTRSLKVVDVDLADTLTTVWNSCEDVLRTLVSHKASGTKVMLTFRNGRDGFGSTDARIFWIRCNMPRGTKVVKHTPYASNRIGKYAEREKGSAMCIVELEIQ